MRKILSIVLAAFLFIGCAQQNNDEHKSKAIEAYVTHSNKLVNQDNFAISLSGKIEAPASVMNKEAVSASLDMNGVINIKDMLIKLDMKVSDDSKKNEDVSMKLYMDSQYMYITDGKNWSKQAVDAAVQKSIKESTKAKAEKLSVEDAEKFFNALKDTKYVEETKDGVAGYRIEGKMDLAQMLKTLNEAEGEAAAKEQIEQVKTIFNKFDLTYSVFVPKDQAKDMIHSITLGAEVLKTKINAGPFNIVVKPSKEKVVIPKEAKKAKVQSPTNFS